MGVISRRAVLAVTLFSAIAGQIGLAQAEEPRFRDVAEVRELVMAALRKARGVKSVVADPEDPAKIRIKMYNGRMATSDVSNTYYYLRAYPDADVDQTIERHVRVVAEMGTEVSERNIVVVIRNRAYTDFSKMTTVEPLTEPLVDDLMVVVMADLPDSMRPLTRQEARRLGGVDGAHLREIGRKNVREWLPKVVKEEASSTGTLFAVDGNEMLSPSLILLDEFWESVKTEFPGDVLIALPRKDQLFIFDAQNPKSERTARALIRVTTEEKFSLLSDKLFARRDGRIVLVPC